MSRSQIFRLLTLATLALTAVLLFTGCDVFAADTPQNTFNPDGEVARKQRDLFLMSMWPALVIMIAVIGAVVVIVLRFRRRSDDEMPVQTHGNTPLELGWTIAPALLLAILGIPMMIILFDIGRDPDENAFVVNVEGQRFSWVFEYPEIKDENGDPLVRIGELFVPTDREVAINLTSIDVIHSFAIPRIAGTRDAIPSIDGNDDGLLDHVETMWIKVEEPRSYYADDAHSVYYQGQCRELCGAEHANMKITLYAMEEADFKRWTEEVRQSASSQPASSDTVRSGSGD